MSDVVIQVDGVSKLYRLGEVGTGSLAHDVNRWWHKVRGKEDPYLKIGEVNDRTKPLSGSKRRNLTTTEHRGRCEMEQSQIGPKGEGVGASESKDTTERLGRGEEEQTKFGPKGEGAGATESKSTEGNAGGNQRADSGEFLEGHSQSGLQMDSEKLAAIRSANASSGSGDQTGSDSESAKISEICG
jgi:hypothetical protein